MRESADTNRSGRLTGFLATANLTDTQLMGHKGPLYSCGWLWVGFAVPMFINSLNAMHAILPSIPQVRLGNWFTILRKTATIPLQIRFEVLGLSYLLSSDVALSLWLFPLLRTFEVACYRLFAINVESAEIYSDPGTPPVAYQGLGAMIALVAIVFYRSRHSF